MKTWSTPVRLEKNKIVPCCICGFLSFKPALNCEGFEYVRCLKCGLVQRNPQPLKEDVISRYNSAFGDDYLSYELKNEDAFFKLQQLALKDASFFKLEKSLFKAALKETPSILDIGCATGSLLKSLRSRLWRVTGVEISPAAEYAINKYGLDIRKIPLEENNFSDNSFDVVLTSHLIEHLNDPRSFLEETHRILKENGSIFITTPNISGFQARLFAGKWRSAIFDHLYLFSAHTLKKLLKSTGFKIVKVRTWGGIAAGIAPAWIKKSLDLLAKYCGFGDVMIIHAKKVSLKI